MIKPFAVFESVWDISAQFFEENGVLAVFLDIDNTLSTHNAATPFPEAVLWIERMKEAGLRLILVSNNHPPRIAPFADKIGLEFVADAKKPLSAGYKEALRRFGLKKSEVCAVGDQIFTDILGANLFGIKSVFVFPKEPETSLPFRIKRAIEKPLLPKFNNFNGNQRI
ncbi:MAG: YqeG family HAD IIIA-type phosphatase [Ruminococcus sp.]|jgi:HAD superfamily phosphatase (TIGR01668 family)|nr:YqeG family HAD IIIA-type phosphatase [Ruminococcus sp.]